MKKRCIKSKINTTETCINEESMHKTKINTTKTSTNEDAMFIN